jgi:hypothetical protein
MKRCFIILGTGNSGSRFLTKLFIASGCIGDDGHKQPFDLGIFPEENKDIVWKTHNPESDFSRPFKHTNVSVETCIKKAKENGYIPVVIILTRDVNTHAIASVTHGYRSGSQKSHTPLIRPLEEEEELMRKSIISFYKNAFDFAERYKLQCKVEIVSYESIVSSRHKYLEMLGKKLNFEFKNIDFIKDANKKHYIRFLK